MPLTHYLTLGRSGLRVSPLCLGAMTFGEDWGWGATVGESERMLDRYSDLGGNFIDTANVYTNGHSEKIIGDHLGRHRSKRHRAVIATKFFGNMRPGDPNAGGAARKNILAACEESLRRLQTDYIDLYWMHCWDYLTPIDETMRALDDLVRSGKVRYIGFSDTPAWKTTQAQMEAHARGWTPLVALQIEYSLLERTVEGELMPMAREVGLGVTPWSPLKGGLLTGKYRREDRDKPQTGRGVRLAPMLNDDRVFNVLAEVGRVAHETGSTHARVALSWLLAQPGVTSPIIGARSVAQLDDNLAALDLHLTPEQIARLSAVSAPNLNFPADFIRNAAAFRNPGLTINGETAAPSPFQPKDEKDFY
jgi:aryl-alcohol dehydrogenase-like predicted oxidoreductase